MDGGGRLGRSVSTWLGSLAEAGAHWRASRAARRRQAQGLHIPRGIGSSAAILFVLACAKQEEPKPVSYLEARRAWARPADSGATSAVYFVLGNSWRRCHACT